MSPPYQIRLRDVCDVHLRAHHICHTTSGLRERQLYLAEYKHRLLVNIALSYHLVSIYRCGACHLYYIAHPDGTGVAKAVFPYSTGGDIAAHILDFFEKLDDHFGHLGLSGRGLLQYKGV